MRRQKQNGPRRARLAKETSLHDAQFLQVGFDHLGRYRYVAIFGNDVLARLGEHHLQELLLHRRERLVRVLVHVNVQEARQRILAGDGVVGAGLDEGLAILESGTARTPEVT